MKNKFLTVILCIGLLIAYFACEKDDTVVKEEKTIDIPSSSTVPILKTVSLGEVGETFNRLKTELQIGSYFQFEQSDDVLSRTTQDTLGITIYTDIIKEVVAGNYSSYTMLIATPNTTDSRFYNLTIEDKSGVADMFVTKYVPTQSWLDDKSKAFEGSISTQRVDTFTTVGIEDGGGTNEDQYPSTDPEGSPYYPSDCTGYVIVTTEQVPYQCGCGDWPWDYCVGCPTGTQFPGYHDIPYYLCVEDNSGTNDNGTADPGGNTGGGTNTGTSNGPDNGTSIGGIVTNEDVPCEPPFSEWDTDENCHLDELEICNRDYGGESSICNCVAGGETLDDCILEEISSTVYFGKKGDGDEVDIIPLSLVLPCFETENNQNGFHDVTIYVRQPVANSPQINSGSDAGHTFVQLTQAVNGNIVTQVIGLYPFDEDVSPNNPQVDGVFVDDSGAEYDVSLNIELTPNQFNNIINYLTEFASINNGFPDYDLNEFNCADFGLQIMNFSDIEIPDSTGEWGGEWGYDIGQGTCPALLGQDIRNTDFGSEVTKDLNGGIATSSTDNTCD